MEENKYKIFIISGGTGRTAKQFVKAALTQFNNKLTELLLFPDIRDLEKVKNIVIDAKKYSAMIIHTLVDNELRDYLCEECKNQNIISIDLMGDIMNKMSNMFKEEPSQTPGLFSRLNHEYFQRIDAVQFTFKHDDGARIDDIEYADIVLLGVSRTFKTPLSIYLAYKGIFVMNIPIVDGIRPSHKINDVDPSKVFCLSTNANKLSELRTSRNVRLGGDVKKYSDIDSCKNELRFAMRYYTMHPEWKVINVTDKAIEEIATEILDILSKKDII